MVEISTSGRGFGAFILYRTTTFPWLLSTTSVQATAAPSMGPALCRALMFKNQRWFTWQEKSLA